MSEAELREPLTEVLRGCVEGFQELTTLERLSGGASQETYRIVVATGDGERRFAMRRAPGGEVSEEAAEARPGLAAEAAMFSAAHAVGVPEPEVLHVLTPDDGVGEGFVMEWLDGEALGARIARHPDFAALREHLAYDCGRILAKIHAIDVEATGLAAHLQVLQPETFVEQMWERYRAFQTPQPMIDYSARWLLDNLPAGARQTLVHNDFRNGNIMVNADEVVAVLDWEVAHIGDPMRDLGWICTNSWRFGVADKPVGGFGLREDLFRGYEDESGIAVDPQAVKFWEVFGSYWWAVGCLGMAEHYRNGPDQTVERPGIGRRSSECQADCVNLLIPGAVTLVEPGIVDGSAAPGASAGFQMPRLDELLLSVRDFLREDVMRQTSGRVQFLARVAANSLDIVDRELRAGAKLEALELMLLHALDLETPASEDVGALRWALVDALREGTLELDDPALIAYLRNAVINQLAIDQPRYSALTTALTPAAHA
ncbi:MAG: phosphotransferase family protein [Pseudomonadota bacterium]